MSMRIQMKQLSHYYLDDVHFTLGWMTLIKIVVSYQDVILMVNLIKDVRTLSGKTKILDL